MFEEFQAVPGVCYRSTAPPLLPGRWIRAHMAGLRAAWCGVDMTCALLWSTFIGANELAGRPRNPGCLGIEESPDFTEQGDC